MDNSVYIALSRQMAVFRDLDVTANNIANADTPGYQQEKMVFTDYLVDDGNRHKMAFTQDIATWRDTSGGPLKHTGNPFDMAIQGPGYFVVETPLGERYTKAGNFSLEANGTLVTQQGYPVLDAGGQRIIFEATDRNVTIGENGLVSAQGPAPGDPREDRGQIAIVEFEDEQKMERLTGQLLRTDQPALEPVASRMQQGVVERSNVPAVTEMVKLTKLSRSVASTAKFIEVMYDLERKTSNVYTKES